MKLRIVLGVGATMAFWTASACSSSSTDRGVAVLDKPDADTADAVAPPPPSQLPGYDGGVGINLLDVADTPCEKRGGTTKVILPADAGAPSMGGLMVAGSRRATVATDGNGLLTFDADGSNPHYSEAGRIRSGGAAPFGAEILFAGTIDFLSVGAQRFDANGAPLGDAVVLDGQVARGISVGSDGQRGFVAYAVPNAIWALAVGATTDAGAAPFELALTDRTNAPTLSIAPATNGLFAFAFSGDDGGESFQTAFGRATATGRAGDPQRLFEGRAPRHVVRLARTPNGFALLLGVTGSQRYAMLVMLDVGGRPTTSGLKLLGTLDGADLAVRGEELGVLARRYEGGRAAVEFRPFDLRGNPLGPWVCLDDLGGRTDLGGGLTADGNGYAAVYRAQDQTTYFARFDRLGTGSP